ncbi:HET domain-containing protein [Microdochium nivale]|nr:HET domain-containing protein [Microdochium nivale]
MLCHHCTQIQDSLIDGITTWLADTRRFSWRGKKVMAVGHHYRHVPATTTCSLCRQLRAPWIVPFLERLPEDSKLSDETILRYYHEPDCIHIFRHLRHLPHVNDYPTSRNMLKEDNAPFHIAVVPSAGRADWKEELQAHISAQGIVAIFPGSTATIHPDRRQREIFEMCEVKPWFEPAVVQRSLAFCRSHNTLCNPRKPKVQGMRIINCWSKDLLIDEYDGSSEYVALSYVWGAPGRSSEEDETSTGADRYDLRQSSSSSLSPATTDGLVALPTKSPKAKGKSTRNLNVRQARRHAPYPSPQASTSASIPVRHLSRAESHVVTTTSQSGSGPILKLPLNIPGTIRDAIAVVKSLHLKYLWVDQYCIDQAADEALKQAQFSRMADIYRGARLTIFALGSNSDSGLPGVSLPRRSWRGHRTVLGMDDKQQYTLISTLPDPQATIAASTWSTRAWTYQEGLCSTRCLFFTPYQVYFECNAMNSTESFRSRMSTLHIHSRKRLRAFHRAGQFVCGNSNSFSHVNVRSVQKAHRKIDVVRRAQYQTQEYTRREMTDNADVLNAFAGVAEFYARSAAMIASLAGLALPAPIARVGGSGTRSSGSFVRRGCRKRRD